MNWHEYTIEMLRTVSADTSLADRLAIARLGIAGESGEIIDHIKKIAYQGHPFFADLSALRLELGDLYWYIALLMDVYGIVWDEIYQPKRREYAEDDTKLAVKLALALSEHVGLLQQAIRRGARRHVTLDRWDAWEMLGHILLDIAQICWLFDMALNDVLEGNVAKLRARYPDGFDAQRSIHRAESGSGDSAESEAQG